MENLAVAVVKYEIEKKNAFTKSFVLYSIHCFALKSEVVRRWSDFFWLRDVLVKQYPGFVVPPVGNKTKSIQNTNEGFIRRRMIFLQRFLTSICKSRELRSSQAFLSFISSPRDDFIKERKMLEQKCYGNTKKNLISFNSIKSLDGDVEVKIDRSFTEASMYYRFLTSKSLPLYEKAYKLSKQLVCELREASGTSQFLFETLDALATVNKDYNTMIVSESSKTSHLETLYKTTAESMTKWSDSFQVIADRLEKALTQTMKYNMMEVRSLEEVSKYLTTKRSCQTEIGSSRSSIDSL